MNKSTKDSKPEPIMRLEAHDRVIEIFGQFQKGDVLDAACGEGALSVRLRDAGFKVRCCDIDPALMKAKDFENREVNLNTDRIDYPDASVDYIACVNCVHRIYNIQNAITLLKLINPEK